MTSPIEIRITQKKEKNTTFIDISSYFSNENLNSEEYLIAKEFSKINPILEQIPTHIMLEKNIEDTDFRKNFPVYQIKPIEQKEQILPLENIFSEPKTTGLEQLLESKNPIIINIGTNNNQYQNNSSYTNQTQRGLDYKLSKASYPRQFAWYDIPKQNIIPRYYKRH